MKRVVCVLTGLLVLCIAAGSAAAQNLGGVLGPPGGSFFPSVPGLSSCDVAGVKLTATGRVGYEWIGLNFNLPTLSPFGVGDGLAPIDIQLKDAHVWIGSLGLDAQLTPRLSLFANGEANARTKAGAVVSDDPFLHLNGRSRYQWNASGLEWWAIEGGAAFNVLEGAAVFAGLRRDHLSFKLEDPRDQFGDPVNFVIPFPGGLISGRNAADLQVKLWVPYVGLRVIGTNCRASLIWSPFVNAVVKIPDNSAFNFVLSPLTLLIGLEWRYSMFQTGSVVEGQFEYDVRLSSNFLISLWAKGSWLRVRGPGNLDKIRNLSLSVPPFIDFFDSLQGDQSATATLSRSLTAVGLAARLEF